jgi:hypothetical protein
LFERLSEYTLGLGSDVWLKQRKHVADFWIGPDNLDFENIISVEMNTEEEALEIPVDEDDVILIRNESDLETAKAWIAQSYREVTWPHEPSGTGNTVTRSELLWRNGASYRSWRRRIAWRNGHTRRPRVPLGDVAPGQRAGASGSRLAQVVLSLFLRETFLTLFDSLPA